MTALPPIQTPISRECQMLQGDWLETKAVRRPFRAAFDLEYLRVAGDGG